jgi:hypothetical protein
MLCGTILGHDSQIGIPGWPHCSCQDCVTALFGRQDVRFQATGQVKDMSHVPQHRLGLVTGSG